MTDTLKELTTRVAGLTFEVAGLRAVLDVQFKRIAAMQAELDLLPAARRRRHAMRAPMFVSPPARNGNGHS